MIRTTKYNQRKTRRTNKVDENFAVLNGEERGTARLLIKYFNKADKENACILFEENGFRYYTNQEAKDVVYDEKGAIVHTKPLILFPTPKPKGMRKPKITVMDIEHPATIGNLTAGHFLMLNDDGQPVKGNVILRKPTVEEFALQTEKLGGPTTVYSEGYTKYVRELAETLSEFVTDKDPVDVAHAVLQDMGIKTDATYEEIEAQFLKVEMTNMLWPVDPLKLTREVLNLVPEPSEVYPTGKKSCGNCGKCKCPDKDTP